MQPYAGFEPHVGEILALRTFRIGPGGALYPLFVDQAWSDGVNTAGCRAPLVDRDSGPTFHLTPDPPCTCGFYAYGTTAFAAEYPNSTHVLAVVACWGRIIAGTRGVRAQYARVDALWMSDVVPPDLAAQVVARYPGATPYADRARMLAEHAPTRLDCYRVHTEREAAVRRRGRRVVLGAAFVVGALPSSWIQHNADAGLIWLGELILFIGAALTLRLTRTDLWAKRETLLYAAAALWLIAPFAGALGVLMLRLPLLEILLIGALQRRRLERRARTFPALIGPSAR